VLVKITLQLGSVWTADRGTVEELGAGAFGTGKEPMIPKGYFLKAFPTSRAFCLLECSYF
jgi:hypothetical protein